MRTLLAASLLSACATAPAAVPSYSERCTDPTRPCSLSYDFEPSGAAPDVFSPPGQFLLVNEDGAVFRWNLDPKAVWDHDHVALIGTFAPTLHKVESATSGVCAGTPVFLAASNFMPGRKGNSPPRERVAAMIGAFGGKVRVLEQTSALIRSLSKPESLAKVEGLGLSPDCRTLFVAIRSYTVGKERSERMVREIHTILLDVDWTGEREEASLGPVFTVDGAGCSGGDEGLSGIVALPDGGLLALTSYEKSTHERASPDDVARGELSGTLWKRGADGSTSRLACFPGHKPESLAVMPDGKSARVVFEDDDYDGRPIRAYGVVVPLP